MKEGVSVIVCTYNGAERLPETMRHIAQQQTEKNIPWEVILVDNNSTDNSKKTATEVWNNYQPDAPLIVKTETEQGLTAARETGILTAHYEYLIFCDDDNWLYPNYVQTAYTIMQQHPSIGVLGGNGELVYEENPPAWLRRLPLLAGGPQASDSGKVQSNLVYGAGCVVRKSAYQFLQQKGFQFQLSDRKGSQLTSGGDHELCYAIALAHYDIWYDGNLHFKHIIDKKRLEWNYWIKYVTESSSCQQVLEPYKMILNGAQPNKLSFLKYLLRNIVYFSRQLIPVYLKRMRLSPNDDLYKEAYLQSILLKKQLKYCLHPSEMEKAFFKIAAMKKVLD